MIPVGSLFAGKKVFYVGIINDMDSGSGSNSYFRNVHIYESDSVGLVDFAQSDILSYGTQDVDVNAFEVMDRGATLRIDGNSWKAIGFTYTVTPSTVNEFDYKSDGVEPEVGAIAIDINLNPDGITTWKIYGTQNFALLTYDSYVPDGWIHYEIPIGQTWTGTMAYLAFINDFDLGTGSNNFFRNVRIYEKPPFFTSSNVLSYGLQDVDSTSFEILDGGATLRLFGNTWKAIPIDYFVRPETFIEFDYRSTGSAPEIGAITVDTDAVYVFDEYWKLYGTQDTGYLDFNSYAPSGWKHYSIPVGQRVSGRVGYMVFINDHDGGSGSNSFFQEHLDSRAYRQCGT